MTDAPHDIDQHDVVPALLLTWCCVLFAMVTPGIAAVLFVAVGQLELALSVGALLSIPWIGTLWGAIAIVRGHAWGRVLFSMSAVLAVAAALLTLHLHWWPIPLIGALLAAGAIASLASKASSAWFLQHAASRTR